MSEKNADVDGFSVPSKNHVSAGCCHCLEKRNVSSHGEPEKSSVTDNRPTVYSLVWQYSSSLPNMLGSPSSSDRMYLFRKRVQKLKKYQRPR